MTSILKYIPYKPRIGIAKVIESLENCVRNNRPFVYILDFPTGYGKSTLSIALSSFIEHESCNLFSRVVHCLPTMTLTEDLVSRAREMNIRSYGQCMIIDPELKSPFFLQHLTFTTYDSYVLNFFKLPIAELHTLSRRLESFTFGHYETARFAIYSALNVFDEFHVYTPGDLPVRIRGIRMLPYRFWITITRILRQLVRSGVPIMLETATLPRNLINFILEVLKDYSKDYTEIKIFKYSDHDKVDGHYVYFKDDDYTSAAYNIKKLETVIEEGKFIDRASELVKRYKGQRVLIVCNNIDRAIELYNKVKTFGVKSYLIHSKFTTQDKLVKISELHNLSRRSKEFVVISTQMIEVGVDLDSDVLITDSAPLASLVQRCGRVVRKFDREAREGIVHIIHDKDLEYDSSFSGIYDLNIVRKTISELKSVIEKGCKIEWKLPFNVVRDVQYISFVKLMDNIYDIDYAKYIYDPEHYAFDILLRIIDDNPIIDSRHVLRLYEELMNFLKTEISVLAYVPAENEIVRQEIISRNYRDLIERCLSIESWRLPDLIRQGVLIRNKILVELESYMNGEVSREVEVIECSSSNKLAEIMKDLQNGNVDKVLKRILFKPILSKKNGERQEYY